jgi:hypothetical protein
MKIILSRKGFDSSNGGTASPILPDGSMVSLPIPHRFKGTPPAPEQLTFGEIDSRHAIGKLACDLTHGCKRPIRLEDPVHFDPDLCAGNRTAWRPLFGQAGSAQRHLWKNGVRAGDLFLFFGWFRKVVCRDGSYRFDAGARDLHVLFGWLRVGEIIRIGSDAVPAWARRHPHAQAEFGPSNTIYVGARKGARYDAGLFDEYTDDLVLTAPQSAKRSYWRLPRWFFPAGRRSRLSYHKKSDRWRRGREHAYLSSVGRGQEFVLDAGDYPEAVDWSGNLIAAHRDGTCHVRRR